MNYRICFIIAVLCPVALLEAGFPALPLYYDFVHNKYVLTKPQETSLPASLLFRYDPGHPDVIYCCPAEDEQQKRIQQEINEDGKKKFQALFVKGVILAVECDHEYEPSVRRELDNEILIGYAVYEITSTKSTNIDWPTENRSIRGFIWVFEKQILYSFATEGGIRSVHYIFPKQHSSEAACPNYDLGINILNYTKEDIERFYSTKNQDKAFEYLQRPVIGSYTEDVVASVPRRGRKPGVQTVSKEAFEQVVPHKLIPTDDFSEIRFKMETCSYLNVFPVWNSIHEGSLKNVERYIREVADKLPANNSLQNKLKVRTRVREKITGTNYGNHGVYLNHEKEEYPVHRIIIKIISYLYSPHEPNQHQEKPKERHLYIAIVIHNELYPPRNTLCRVNMCGLLGWHVASLEGGLVYCCSLDDLPDLVMQEDIRVDYKPFNLNEILPKGVHPPSPPVEVAGTNPAIIVLYYPQEGTYKYVDFKELRELHLQNNIESQFTDIILYCPPETIDEQVSASILKVDLMFVRKIVKSVADIGDPNICVNHYKPSIWFGSVDAYHVGYLVSEHDDSLRTRDLHKRPEKGNLEYRGVTLFWINYNTYLLTPLYSEHVMIAKSLSAGLYDLCENHMKTGLERMKNETEGIFVKGYNRENQQHYQHYAYDSSQYYFVRKQLVPSDDFDDNGRKLATCSYLNTYPVWNIVNRALLGFENYLRKILQKSQILDEFCIHTRLTDTLELPFRSDDGTPQRVYLNPDESKITVPARIVKIIGHRVPLPVPQKQDRDSNKIEYKYYFMAIVFENKIQREFDHFERCEQVINCIDYGWHVQEWEWAGNRPYCCDLEIIRYGDENDELPFTAQEGQYEILDLQHVVIKLDKSGVPAEHKNIAELVNH